MDFDDGALLPAQDVTTIVRQPMGDQLLVSACGRTCSIDMQYSRSIAELQAALQRTLQMEGQAFHILDINGQLLSTDMQVHDAIAQGLIPLCATLPDKSLHHLENRREELAQMQWKLIRDQMTQSANQMSQVSRQISELQFNLQAHQRECEGHFESLRGELAKVIEIERMTSKAELQPVQEAVNGAVLLINSERSKRELSVQGFEKHIHGLCDMLDNERSGRRQEMAAQFTVIQELRGGLESERAARDTVEDMIKDLKLKLMQLREESSNGIQESREQLRRAQADANISVTDSLSRFSELEDRCAAIENSINDNSSYNTNTLDKLNERMERQAQAVETLRLSSKHHEGSIANSLERVKEMEGMVRTYDMDVREQFQREKTVRDDSLRRIQQAFSNDCKKQIGELEKRLTVRLERESSEREKNFQAMIDEVGRVVQERKPQAQYALGSKAFEQLGKRIEEQDVKRTPSERNYPEESPQPSFIVGTADGTSEFPLASTPATSFQPEVMYAPTVPSVPQTPTVVELVASAPQTPTVHELAPRPVRSGPLGTGEVLLAGYTPRSREVLPVGYTPRSIVGNGVSSQAYNSGVKAAGAVSPMIVPSMGGSLQAPPVVTSPRLGMVSQQRSQSVMASLSRGLSAAKRIG